MYARPQLGGTSSSLLHSMGHLLKERAEGWQCERCGHGGGRDRPLWPFVPPVYLRVEGADCGMKWGGLPEKVTLGLRLEARVRGS